MAEAAVTRSGPRTITLGAQDAYIALHGVQLVGPINNFPAACREYLTSLGMTQGGDPDAANNRAPQAVQRNNPKRRKMSAAGRARISEAVKARHANQRAGGATATAAAKPKAKAA